MPRTVNCTAPTCNGIVTAGPPGTTVHALGRGERYAGPHFVAWCKNCGRKYEIVPPQAKAA